MDRPISKYLHNLFLIHFIATGIFGLVLWLVPGRMLSLVGWLREMVQLPGSELSVPGMTFANPVFVRLAGAAFLSLAFVSFQSWRAKQWGDVILVVQQGLLFYILAALAILAEVLDVGLDLPTFGWVFLVIMILFALGWGFGLWQQRGEPTP